jgi:hypothetical protein
VPVMSAAAKEGKSPAPGEKPPRKSVQNKPDGKAKNPKLEKKPLAKKKNPGAAAKSERKRLQKRADLRKDLMRELAQVRESLAVSAQAFVARLDGEFTRVFCAFEGETIPGEPERLPLLRAQATMLLAIRDLRVKPEKGRLKDLGRLADLGDLIARLMPQGG